MLSALLSTRDRALKYVPFFPTFSYFSRLLAKGVQLVLLHAEGTHIRKNKIKIHVALSLFSKEKVFPKK